MFWIWLACTSSEKETAIANDERVENVPAVWYGDIEPFVTENCTTCHYEGGAAPFTFETLAQVQPLASVMLNSMRTGYMPPWLPDTECREYVGERAISEEQIARFASWIEEGMKEGDNALGVSERPLTNDIDATISVTMPTGFIPVTAVGADQYRCFPLDIHFDQETFISQTQAKPGSSQVHHVLVYALAPEMSDAVTAANGADGVVGYPCFGDPFPAGSGSYDYGFPTQIGAWAPGIQPAIFPEDTALRVKAGSPVVMQVHYSAVGGEAVEDSSSYHIVTRDTPPSYVASTRPLAILDLDIPAGESNASFSQIYTNYYNRPFEIASLATHMHLLGRSQKATILRQDGTEECALHIPEWDFAWQQSYRPVERILLESGEQIELTCTYDNSAENQPIIEGEQIDASDVGWGDGTLDEMCLLYTTTIDPYRPSRPADSADCYGVEACIEDCGESLSCVMECELVDFSCLTCSLDAFLDCGLSECLIQGAQARGCLEDCYAKSIMMGSPIGACLAFECPNEYDALTQCADPVIRSDSCRADIEACGIPLSE